jgi:ketosteroid isomerase-like protein
MKEREEPFDLASVQKHISEANSKYGDRFTSNDSLMYAARYHADAVIFPAESALIKGRDGIRNYYYDGGKNVDLIIVITALDIYGNRDLVVEEGLYDFPDGKGASFDKGKFIALWKPEGGAWKLYREIWNTDLAPANAP